MSDVPNPGSREATESGCTCAVLDNARGRGYMGQPGIFVISADCPMHGLGHGVEGTYLSGPKAATPNQTGEVDRT